MIRILTGCHKGTCAEITCDDCGDRYDERDGDGVQHVDPDFASAALTDAGWTTTGERHYCSAECAGGER